MSQCKDRMCGALDCSLCRPGCIQECNVCGDELNVDDDCESCDAQFEDMMNDKHRMNDD